MNVMNMVKFGWLGCVGLFLIIFFGRLYYSNKIETLENTLSAVKTVKTEQDNTIIRLIADRKSLEAALLSRQNEYEKMLLSIEEIRAKIKEVTKNDAATKKWSSTVLPGHILNVLRKPPACDKDGNATDAASSKSFGASKRTRI